MNPPGVYDKDPAGFFFIPTYSPQSKNFYIRAAIEDPRPILGHEGIPGHILRLSRYRGARIGVDVNLHTGKWTFEQAVKYFMDAGGLDREAAEGEAAGAA